MSTTSFVARQCRLREWTKMIQDCQNRSEKMSVDEWCEAHSLTKANYYYRMTQVRKACLDAVPKEVLSIAGTVDTGSDISLTVVEAFQPQNFSIINHGYRPPIKIVTQMCAKLIIGYIKRNAQQSGRLL